RQERLLPIQPGGAEEARPGWARLNGQGLGRAEAVAERPREVPTSPPESVSGNHKLPYRPLTGDRRSGRMCRSQWRSANARCKTPSTVRAGDSNMGRRLTVYLAVISIWCIIPMFVLAQDNRLDQLEKRVQRLEQGNKSGITLETFALSGFTVLALAAFC